MREERQMKEEEQDVMNKTLGKRHNTISHWMFGQNHWMGISKDFVSPLLFLAHLETVFFSRFLFPLSLSSLSTPLSSYDDHGWMDQRTDGRNGWMAGWVTAFYFTINATTLLTQ